MRVSALRIAEAIMSASGTTPDPTAAEDMAVCISHGNGALRIGDTRTIWMILDSFAGISNAALAYPLPVRGSLRVTPRPGAILTTNQVAETFRDAARPGIGRPHQDFPANHRRTWAPYATISNDPKPMGGVPDGAVVANTIDVITKDNEFNWVDLEPMKLFPVGCLVFRYKENRSLTGYQRLQHQRWLNVNVQDATCPIDLAALMSELEVDSIEPFHAGHPRPLLFRSAG